jgi:4a-hydroxytetrahydrobiopterin dehydratase
MSSLTSEKCVACRRDAPRVTAVEIEELRPQVPDWELVERDGIPRLERVFRFANFAEALAFTNRVGSSPKRKAIIPLCSPNRAG